jgi:DNA invertase Pin-like site-specific DNA recombinase
MFDLGRLGVRDRFSREGTLATLQYLEKRDAAGVGWRSFQVHYLDSADPFKGVVISLMATVAKQERIRISERTRTGLRTARKNGKQLGCPRVGVDVAKVRNSRLMAWACAGSQENWLVPSSIMRSLHA